MAIEQEYAANNQVYEWSCLRFNVTGQRVFSARAFNAKCTRDGMTLVFGSGSDPIGKTFGNKNYAGSITILWGEWLALRAALLQEAVRQGVDHVTEVAFAIHVTYRLTKRGALKTLVIRDASITETPLDASQGAEPIAVALPFIYMGEE